MGLVVVRLVAVGFVVFERFVCALVEWVVVRVVVELVFVVVALVVLGFVEFGAVLRMIGARFGRE